GADPVPAAPAAPAAPVVSTSMGACNGGYGGCCGISNDCGCEGGRQRLCDRLKGMFKRGHNDCGCEAAPTCAPAHHHHAATTSCGCEDTCKKPGLCARLKGRFKRGNDCGCDTGSSCGCGGGAYGTYGGTGI